MVRIDSKTRLISAAAAIAALGAIGGCANKVPFGPYPESRVVDMGEYDPGYGELELRFPRETWASIETPDGTGILICTGEFHNFWMIPSGLIEPICESKVSKTNTETRKYLNHHYPAPFYQLKDWLKQAGLYEQASGFFINEQGTLYMQVENLGVRPASEPDTDEAHLQNFGVAKGFEYRGLWHLDTARALPEIKR
ncbi:hypothetical protein IPC1147_33545 [Pseudomonas aeruginosa]|uniref:hypothetical protein n=1 Tax=Pseudomonas aeruginosa TaxID=287 RepID=UPI000FFF282B|nr:hypothetical protein [Pseudomonas aeruginosa]MBA5106096.1 hypothetical protein [Pseudomonas aeruginosa]MBH8258750.1 hypothetical protein [Pseudomonas aeruginosa]MDP5990031.1 hypothetical protein [Pseudomonas aeruginosa]NPS41209.1 hypothetical protein [Pseudomonas aeruginosa]NPS90511.1 hypothetical protein [Pseudomonas aeruginosa]